MSGSDLRARASGPAPGATERGLAPYDAVLLLSYGGPNDQEEVIPFLRNVTAGTGVPVERLAVVGEHYRLFDGRSPINAENLALIGELGARLRAAGCPIPVLFGNVHWYPRTIDTLRAALSFGARRILVLITSAYASYSGSRKYREHLAAVLDELGEAGRELTLEIVRPYFNAPGFIAANARAIRRAIMQLGVELNHAVHIAYVTHSIPTAMDQASGETGPTYLAQHQLVCRLLDEQLGQEYQVSSSLSFCSRSGSPRTPWLEPDISQRLDDLASWSAASAQPIGPVVIAPIGFISDHMEVVYDLDIVAISHARELGLQVARAATAGTQPEFIDGLVELLRERAARERGEPAHPKLAGELAALPDVAPPGSCRREPGVASGLPVIAGPVD